MNSQSSCAIVISSFDYTVNVTRSETPTTATQRNLVMRVAESDPDQAFVLADEIPDSWYATQSLASVLRYTTIERMGEVSDKALHRAAMCSDAYSRGAVLAWVIRALAERGLASKAAEVLAIARQEVHQASPASSRAEALSLLYEAAFPLGARVIEPLLHELITLQKSDPHWRVSRALVHAVAIHSGVASGSLQSIIPLIEDPKIVARINREIQLGLATPRPFFWSTN